MPTIKIPENIKLLNPDGSSVQGPDGKDVTLDFVKTFLIQTLTNDAKFGKNVTYLYAAMDLQSLFNDANPGDCVFLSQDVYDKLKEVVNEPTVPYNTSVMKQCRTFFQAILDPEKK